MGGDPTGNVSMGVLSAAVKDRVRPLLQLNDKIRKLISVEADINVMAIVVVGDQSHGKSSVIEALSGIDLPRGEGIKTRLPLTLYLKGLEGTGRSDPHASIGVPSKNIAESEVGLSDISKTVESLTEKVAGDSCNVLDFPIELTVWQKDQDDLTLIDLPGLTRLPTKDQPENIEEIITEMYRKYMEPKETVLLNVVSVLPDVSTSASLKLSREYDPEAKRTLLCFTKADQFADEGLREKVLSPCEMFNIPSENIFVVRNRSAAENSKGLSLQQARKNEAGFLKRHVDLSKLPQHMLGAAALSEHLVVIQQDRIRETLPQTKEAIARRFEERQKEFASMPVMPRDRGHAGVMFQRICSDLVRQLDDERTGRAAPGTKTPLQCAKFLELKEEFSRGMVAHDIAYFFSSEFIAQLKMEAGYRRGGEGLPGSVMPDVVVGLVRSRIKGLHALVNKFTEDAAEGALAWVKMCVLKGMKDYPRLLKVMLLSAEETLRGESDDLKKYTNGVLGWEDEMDTVHTSYPLFVKYIHERLRESTSTPAYAAGNNRSPSELLGSLLQGAFTVLEDPEVRRRVNELDFGLKEMVVGAAAYWKVMLERLVDVVVLTTKNTVMSKSFIAKLEDSLTTAFHEKEDPQKLYQPDREARQNRERCVHSIRNLEEATKLLRELDTLLD